MMALRCSIVALLLAVSCKKDTPAPPPPQAATTAPAVDETPAPVPATPEPEVAPPATAPAPPSSQEALAAVLRDLSCKMKRADRDGLATIYAERGFKSSSDFATAFAEARKADAAWAERVLAEAVKADCTPQP